METLKRILGQIQEQLGHLNTSQKVAIGLCAVVVGGSFMWLLTFSTSPEMVPVLGQDLSLTDLQAAMDTLKSEGIMHEQRGNRVYVKQSDRNKALLSLNRAEVLPQDISIGFAELMADSDPFRPIQENEFRRRVALGNELAQIIASSDDVESARVIVQDKSKRRIGAMPNIKPTASVYVKMSRSKILTQTSVDAMCRLVSSAVSGMAAHDVTVMDANTMRAFTVPDPEDALGMGLLEETKKNEGHIAAKIMAALQSIPGVLVSVSVELDPSKSSTQTTKWDKPAVKEEQSDSSNTQQASGPSESGVNPNVGVALSANATGTKSETDSTKNSYFDPKQTEIRREEKAPFTVRRATASVSIPRSFLVGVYQARFGEADEPAKLDEDESFISLRQTELARVRSSVMSILMTKDESDVAVDIFYDFSPEGGELRTFPGGTAVAVEEAGAVDYLRNYGMQGALVVLSMISFLMMGRLVRKSSAMVRSIKIPEEAVGEEEDLEGTLHVAGGPVGEALVSEGLLEGQEVDEETLRYTQLGDQVSKMVEDNPEMAADLIRRWAQGTGD